PVEAGAEAPRAEPQRPAGQVDLGDAGPVEAAEEPVQRVRVQAGTRPGDPAEAGRLDAQHRRLHRRGPRLSRPPVYKAGGLGVTEVRGGEYGRRHGQVT